MTSKCNSDQRYCSSCDTFKSITEFHLNGGKPRCYCAKCTNKKVAKYRKDRAQRDPAYAEKLRRAPNISARKIRQSLDPQAMCRFILQDSKNGDRKRGRANDLDREFVLSVVSKPCTYCGESELRMTLDRIDNTLGHTKNNVVGACIRCNMARGSMPYAAWLHLTPGMTAARLAGAFQSWTGKIERGSKKPPEMSR